MIGRGLDVSTALVEGKDFVDLSRNVSLRFERIPTLISTVPPVKRHTPVYIPEYEEADQPFQRRSRIFGVSVARQGPLV